MSLMLLPSLHSASPLPTPHTALVLGRMNHGKLDPLLSLSLQRKIVLLALSL